MISCASRMMSTACSKAGTSKVPSGRRNFIRFSDARLQAESSTCMYSEHGLDALIRPLCGQVCQRLIVVSYCTPGSAQRHAALAISRISSRAGIGSPTGSPVVRAISRHSPSVLDRLHELVGDAHRVVGVLVLDRLEAGAVDRHVEAGVAQRRRLLLLVGLAADELADVRVVDVEHDHLRGAARLAAGLDRAGPGVGAAHERDRARRRCRPWRAAPSIRGCSRG